MNRKKIIKVVGILLIAGLLFQTAILTYANIFGDAEEVDTSKVTISQEVLDLIRSQDPDNFNKNVKNYKRMLVILDVHNTFKDEIERLVKEGKKLTDLMIAYQFLYDAYGKITDLETMVNERESGKNWVEIFTWYNTENPGFIPSNFDFDYLEQLSQISEITSDDIMIADRVSQQSGMPFDEVIEERISGRIWKDINASFGILNSQSTIPHVPVTPEQLKKYTLDGVLSEEKVVETLVTAFKLGMDEEDAIAKAKAGYTTEQFFAEALEALYY